MNKLDIINQININTKISKRVCLKVVNSFIEIIKESLNKGQKISINNFGSWKPKLVKEKKLYLPLSDNYIFTKRKIIARFKVSKKFNISFK